MCDFRIKNKMKKKKSVHNREQLEAGNRIHLEEYENVYIYFIL